MNHEICIELRNVTKRFGSTVALDQVSFAVRSGEVHALLGENGAGKSTLINVLSGDQQPDGGEIVMDGQPLRFREPHDAAKRGISVVHQELALCANLTAAENISLSAAARSGLFQPINRRKCESSAKEWLARLELRNLSLDVPVRRLRLGEQQLIEIAKALASQLRVLVLDEPNSALTSEESRALFRVVRQLRSDGIAIVYVSHRLEEVLDLADRITVMRDGRVIDSGIRSDYAIGDLIRKMVGRELDHLFHRVPLASPVETDVLTVRDLSSGRSIQNVSFSVRRGEIYGIAGLPGSGKDEIVDCLCGMRRCSGEFMLEGRSIGLLSPAHLLGHGMAAVPADRRGAGVFLVLSIRDNVAAANLHRLNRFGILHPPAMRRLAETFLPRMRLKASSLDQRLSALSGGNQQKVVLARGLATEPKLLLVHEPTRGIDIGAKSEIYQILNQLAAKGIAILIISSELPELLGQCDRIAVLHQGRLIREFAREEFNDEHILACAMGQSSIIESVS